MSRIRCFWLEETDQVEISLRRYASGDGCPSSGLQYHNASVVIGRDAKANVTDVHGDNWPHADPRWPARCGCGYEFKPEDHWQFNPHMLFRRVDTGELMVLGDAPAGAMWDGHWLRDSPRYKRREDGIVLLVRTPGGDWAVDGPATNGPGWERTGSPKGAAPDVTAHPSIVAGNYHGWLRGGWLEPA